MKIAQKAILLLDMRKKSLEEKITKPEKTQ